MPQLTNGGKPHKCYEIAVHDTPTNKALFLCSLCNMAVDQPKDSPQQPWREEFRQKWAKSLPNGFLSNSQVPTFYPDRELVESFIEQLLADERKRVMEIIEKMKTDERKVSIFGQWEAVTFADKMFVNAVLEEALTLINQEEK